MSNHSDHGTGIIWKDGWFDWDGRYLAGSGQDFLGESVSFGMNRRSCSFLRIAPAPDLVQLQDPRLLPYLLRRSLDLQSLKRLCHPASTLRNPFRNASTNRHSLHSLSSNSSHTPPHLLKRTQTNEIYLDINQYIQGRSGR